MNALRALPCENRLHDNGDEFWCEELGQWFSSRGLECKRCRAGLPVTTDAYRRWLADRRATETEGKRE